MQTPLELAWQIIGEDDKKKDIESSALASGVCLSTLIRIVDGRRTVPTHPN